MTKYTCACDNKTRAMWVIKFSYECEAEVACTSCKDKHLAESPFNKAKILTPKELNTFDPNEMKQPDWK